MKVAIVDVDGEIYGAGEGIQGAIDHVIECTGCDPSEIEVVDRTGCLTMRGVDTHPDELIAVECTEALAEDPTRPWEWDCEHGILRLKD
jgi:hypothetical protein